MQIPQHSDSTFWMKISLQLKICQILRDSWLFGTLWHSWTDIRFTAKFNNLCFYLRLLQITITSRQYKRHVSVFPSCFSPVCSYPHLPCIFSLHAPCSLCQFIFALHSRCSSICLWPCFSDLTLHVVLLLLLQLWLHGQYFSNEKRFQLICLRGH